jgi:hypothetical protein
MDLSMSRIVSTFIICLALLASTGAVAKNASNRAVALKLEAFEDGFRLCSREVPQNITAYWELGEAEVTRIDQELVRHIGRTGVRQRLTLAPDGYVRQYLGLVRDGKRFAYVNAFPLRAGEDVSRARAEFAKWCDGGGLFWGIEYDMQTRTFLNFAVNSSMQRDPLEGLRL